MGTRNEAVLTCTKNQCFEQQQKKENYNIFSPKNYHFYSREISQYIAFCKVCLHNVIKAVQRSRIFMFYIIEEFKSF